MFLKLAKRNWKTTTAGILGLVGVGLKMGVAATQVGTMPVLINAFTDPTTVGLISASVGLIAAKDGDKTGVEDKPKDGN